MIINQPKQFGDHKPISWGTVGKWRMDCGVFRLEEPDFPALDSEIVTMLTSTNRSMGKLWPGCDQLGWPPTCQPDRSPAHLLSLVMVVQTAWLWVCHNTLSQSANGKDLDKMILRASSRLAMTIAGHFLLLNVEIRHFSSLSYRQSGNQGRLSFIVFPPSVLHFHQSSARQILGQPKLFHSEKFSCIAEM